MAIIGTFQRYERFFATSAPTRSPVINPGPVVAAMASGFFLVAAMDVRHSFITSSTTGRIFSACIRPASSGTTPPYFLCTSTWLAVFSARTTKPSSLQSSSATDVSSHDDSMPKIYIYKTADETDYNKLKQITIFIQ